MIDFLNGDTQPWMGRGLCADGNPDDWFPHATQENRAAKTLCNGCPSLLPCLQYALDNPELQGIWGGTTEGQRAELRPLHGKPLQSTRPPCDEAGTPKGHNAHRVNKTRVCDECLEWNRMYKVKWRAAS